MVLPTSGHTDQKREQKGAARGRSLSSQAHHLGELLEQVGQRPPQIGIVLLQRFDLFLVHPVAVGMGRHLIEIICTPPLEGHQLLDGGKVNMEDIAVEGHFADIGAHVADARLLHAAPDGLQLVRPHPYIERHIPDALFPGHATCRPGQGSPAWAGPDAPQPVPPPRASAGR